MEKQPDDVRLEFILNRMDSLLLSLGSLLSVIYAIINTQIHPSLILVYFIPIAILYFVPIWIGYIRGSIVLDRRIERLEERIRGFIYLIGGALGYLAHFVFIVILESFIIPQTSPQIRLILFSSVILVVLGFTYFFFLRKAFPGTKIHSIIYKNLKIESPPYSTKKIVKLSNKYALLFGVWLYGLTLFIARYNKTLLSKLVIGSLLLIVLIVLVLGEKKIRKNIDRSLESKNSS